MPISFTLKARAAADNLFVFIGSKIPTNLPLNITSKNQKALNTKPAKWQKVLSITDNGTTIVRIPDFDGKGNRAEYYRQSGAETQKVSKRTNNDSIFIAGGDEMDVLSLCEGLALSDYRFETYKSDPAQFHLKKVGVLKSISKPSQFKELESKLAGIFLARDLVNEPANILTATEFAKRIKKAGKVAGFEVDILGKTKIKSLKMGGLLAVNKGSTQEPTFTVIEYKPSKPQNKRPVVLVGKGIVYDTGGLSLKPTPNSMDIMKCDMGGGAAVVGAIFAAAKARLPIHIIGLVPATDNQPGPDAYCPGDVITMMDGTRVEVMNTDAEGRLVLADALAFAKRYNPELAIDLATLTGASIRAVGYCAATLMGTADEKRMNQLKEAGFKTWERVVELPLWSDYAVDLQSDIADMRNIGASPLAGAIVAGKFLEHFALFPWMHLDIAGPAFLPTRRGYLPKGGTGYGVNLLFQFLKDYTK